MPAASDQMWSEVATHWGLRHGGPSETDVSSSVSKLSTLQTLSSSYIQFYHLVQIIIWPHSQALPSFLLLAVQKSGRGPGIIYHMSDIEGRENVERT